MKDLLGLPSLLFALVVVGIVIGAIMLAATLAATITKWILFFKYQKYKNTQSSSGMTASQLARAFLDSNGLEDVKIEKAGFFRAFFYGNHYSFRKKTIYLRKNLVDSNSITAVGIALQKVGLALQHKEGGAQFKAKATLGQLAVFGPLLFVPIAVIGVIIDAFIFNMSGVASLVGCIIGFVFYLLATIFAFLNVKVEKRANSQALYMLENGNFFNEQDMESVRSLFKTYIASYIADTILAFMKLLYYFFKVFLKAFSVVKKK